MDDKDLVLLILNGDIEFNKISEKLYFCAFRKEIYKELHIKDSLLKYENLIRHLMSIEMEERSKDIWDDETVYADYYDYECFYWAIFFIYRLGNVSDVKIIWEAKYIDFDTSLGVDMQWLIGAGVENTISFLEREPDEKSKEILKYIKSCRDEGHFDDLERWYNYRYQYFLNVE